MTTVQKFMFDNRFDVSEPVEPQADEQVAVEHEHETVSPTFSEEDLNAARQEGFDAGKQDGYEAAATSTEDQISSILAKLDDQFGAVFAAQQAVNEAMTRAAVSVAASIVGKMMPALNEKYGIDEILAVVEQALGHLRDEPRVVIKVAENLAAAVHERVSQMARAHGATGEITVIGDPALGDGDCQLTWSNGEAVRDVSDLQATIDEIVHRHSEAMVSADEIPSAGSVDNNASEDLDPENGPADETGAPEDVASPRGLDDDDLTRADSPDDADSKDAAQDSPDRDLVDDGAPQTSPTIGEMAIENAGGTNTPPNTP
jgi:flagellar assembly protein FliH